MTRDVASKKLSPGAARPAGRERRLVLLEGLAWVLPLGFVLAACYLASGRERASNLVLIAIPFNIALWVFIVGYAALSGMPNC